MCGNESITELVSNEILNVFFDVVIASANSDEFISNLLSQLAEIIEIYGLDLVKEAFSLQEKSELAKLDLNTAIDMAGNGVALSCSTKRN